MVLACLPIQKGVPVYDVKMEGLPKRVKKCLATLSVQIDSLLGSKEVNRVFKCFALVVKFLCTSIKKLHVFR